MNQGGVRASKMERRKTGRRARVEEGQAAGWTKAKGGVGGGRGRSGVEGSQAGVKQDGARPGGGPGWSRGQAARATSWRGDSGRGGAGGTGRPAVCRGGRPGRATASEHAPAGEASERVRSGRPGVGKVPWTAAAAAAVAAPAAAPAAARRNVAWSGVALSQASARVHAAAKGLSVAGRVPPPAAVGLLPRERPHSLGGAVRHAAVAIARLGNVVRGGGTRPAQGHPRPACRAVPLLRLPLGLPSSCRLYFRLPTCRLPCGRGHGVGPCGKAAAGLVEVGAGTGGANQRRRLVILRHQHFVVVARGARTPIPAAVGHAPRPLRKVATQGQGRLRAQPSSLRSGVGRAVAGSILQGTCYTRAPHRTAGGVRLHIRRLSKRTVRMCARKPQQMSLPVY